MILSRAYKEVADEKILALSIISALTFVVGGQGFDVPNKKAPFIGKLCFAGSLSKALAAGPEEDAGKVAEGLWRFAIESELDADPSIYEFVTEVLDNTSDEMINLCSNTFFGLRCYRWQ